MTEQQAPEGLDSLLHVTADAVVTHADGTTDRN